MRTRTRTRPTPLISLVTAAVLSLGVIVAAAPASAAPQCATSSREINRAGGHGADRLTTAACIERRDGIIVADGYVKRTVTRDGLRNYHHSAGVTYTLYEGTRVVAVKRCNLRSSFDTKATYHACSDTVLFPAASGRSYKVVAELRMDYKDDGRGEYVLPKAYSPSIRG